VKCPSLAPFHRSVRWRVAALILVIVTSCSSGGDVAGVRRPTSELRSSKLPFNLDIPMGFRLDRSTFDPERGDLPARPGDVGGQLLEVDGRFAIALIGPANWHRDRCTVMTLGGPNRTFSLPVAFESAGDSCPAFYQPFVRSDTELCRTEHMILIDSGIPIDHDRYSIASISLARQSAEGIVALGGAIAMHDDAFPLPRLNPGPAVIPPMRAPLGGVAIAASAQSRSCDLRSAPSSDSEG
jgi:hypothetical protein